MGDVVQCWVLEVVREGQLLTMRKLKDLRLLTKSELEIGELVFAVLRLD